MRGTKAKAIRNAVHGNPLARLREYYGPGPRVCKGPRRAYRVAKAIYRGEDPRPPIV